MEQQMLIPFRVNRAHHNLQFFVAHDRVAALRVQFGDQVAQRRDQRVGLRNDLVALQAEVAVQPVRHACRAGGCIHRDKRRTVQNLRRVENVVDFFVLQQTVGMDARAGDVEVAADKRLTRAD